MKKQILLFSVISVLSSCNFSNKTSEADKVINDIRISEMTDSIINNTSKNMYLDSTGMDKSPVRVTSAKFVTEEYSNYKKIRLSYKNVSDKTIQAIRFEWYGENAFGEPADMGTSVVAGAGGGFTDEKLRPNASSSGNWDILSRDGKKILMARAYEVVFEDGTKWSLRK